MGIGVRIDENGRWRDKDGRYAKPPQGFQPPPAPPTPTTPVDYPPPPPPIPPPPEPELELPEDGERPELGERPADGGGEELPPEEPPDWAPEDIEDGPSDTVHGPPPAARPEPVGMSTSDLMKQLGVGNLWAGLIRLVATPKGYKPAPVTEGEAAQYTVALAAVADRYFPTIRAPELILLALVTAGGAKNAYSNALPPGSTPRDGEEAPKPEGGPEA